MKELLWSVALLQNAVEHDGNALPQGHRLDLVVGDEHRRYTEPVV